MSKCKHKDNFSIDPKTNELYKECNLCRVKRKEWTKNNPEKVKLHKKTTYEKNKDKNYKTKQNWVQNNKEKVAARQKQWYNDNKQKVAEWGKKYRTENKEKISKTKSIYIKNKLKNDSSFKLRRNISSTIYQALRENDIIKDASILKVLPYTIEQLKQHLESQFEDWMNWENWTVYDPNTWKDNDQSTWTWNIDHIIPKYKFNFTSIDCDDVLKCWALENLRPLNAKENILDGANKTR